jgi:head-tail adaptor
MNFDPGQLRERVRFDPRADQPADDLNNVQTDFDPTQGVTRRALYLMRPGSEAMTNARLSGRQPVTMIVRFDSQTSTITPEWRAVDLRTGVIYAIQAAADMDRRRQWISLVCEAGVQT